MIGNSDANKEVELDKYLNFTANEDMKIEHNSPANEQIQILKENVESIKNTDFLNQNQDKQVSLWLFLCIIYSLSLLFQKSFKIKALINPKTINFLNF